MNNIVYYDVCNFPGSGSKNVKTIGNKLNPCSALITTIAEFGNKRFGIEC